MALRHGFGLRSWLTALVTLVGLGCVAPFVGCQADDASTEDASAVSPDAGGSRDTGTPGVQDVADATGDTATNSDGGRTGSPIPDANPGAAEASDTQVDSGPVCVPHGNACSDEAGSLPCCTDTCLNDFCGCLPEGAHLPDGGGGISCL